jgi:hypothetical protein
MSGEPLPGSPSAAVVAEAQPSGFELREAAKAAREPSEASAPLERVPEAVADVGLSNEAQEVAGVLGRCAGSQALDDEPLVGVVEIGELDACIDAVFDDFSWPHGAGLQIDPTGNVGAAVVQDVGEVVEVDVEW